jgi:hypothetical protein
MRSVRELMSTEGWSVTPSLSRRDALELLEAEPAAAGEEGEEPPAGYFVDFWTEAAAGRI